MVTVGQVWRGQRTGSIYLVESVSGETVKCWVNSTIHGETELPVPAEDFHDPHKYDFAGFVADWDGKRRRDRVRELFALPEGDDG